MSDGRDAFARLFSFPFFSPASSSAIFCLRDRFSRAKRHPFPFIAFAARLGAAKVDKPLITDFFSPLPLPGWPLRFFMRAPHSLKLIGDLPLDLPFFFPSGAARRLQTKVVFLSEDWRSFSFFSSPSVVPPFWGFFSLGGLFLFFLRFFFFFFFWLSCVDS